MIIVRITMGLGNQMFQYAAALALSLEKNTQLKVDISSYKGYKLRNYELENCFNINTAKATAEEIASFRFDNPVKKVWNKLLPNKTLTFKGCILNNLKPIMYIKNFKGDTCCKIVVIFFCRARFAEQVDNPTSYLRRTKANRSKLKCAN